MEIKAPTPPVEQEFDSRGNPIIDAEFYDIPDETSPAQEMHSDQKKLPYHPSVSEKTVGGASSNLVGTTNQSQEIIGERADMAEKIQATEKEMSQELAGLKLEAADIMQIEEALEDVSTGAQDEVTIYIEDKRAEVAYLSGRYGEEKSLKKAEAELAAAEKKESSFLQSNEALLFTNQKINDSVLDPETRAKHEKNKTTLENLTKKLEGKRQSQDRGFAEKNMTWAKENIAHRWLKAKWYNKVAIGAGLSTLTLGASQVITRPLGLYASYQGIKEGKISKLTNAISKLEESGKSDDAKLAEIEKILIENNLDKKSLLGALALSATFAGLGEVIAQSGVLETAGNYIAEKSAIITAPATDLTENVLADTNSGETVAVVAGASAAAESVVVEANNTIVAGDTMYSLLEREFDISSKLPEEGQQYNAIENILAQIRQNPSEYGISSGNINELAVGDTLNIEKIQEIIDTHKIGDQGIFEHALGLPREVINGIENYMPADAKAAFVAISQSRASEALAATALTQAPNDSLDAVIAGLGVQAQAETATDAPPSDIAGPVPAGAGPVIISETLEPVPSGVTVIAEQIPGASVVAEDDTTPAAPSGITVTYEPIAFTQPEVGDAMRPEYASLNMTSTESISLNRTLMSEVSRLGGNWATDIVRFGTEPINTFIAQRPTGSEKALALIESYRATSPIQPNENVTVMQYLQRAALLKVRATNIV